MIKVNPNIDESDFIRYLEDKMTNSERNAFEKELQKHPFEAEALEGLETILPGKAKKDIDELKTKIKPLKRRNNNKYWAAAATVLLIVSAGVIFTHLNKRTMPLEVAGSQTTNENLGNREKAFVDEVPVLGKNVEVNPGKADIRERKSIKGEVDESAPKTNKSTAQDVKKQQELKSKNIQYLVGANDDAKMQPPEKTVRKKEENINDAVAGSFVSPSPVPFTNRTRTNQVKVLSAPDSLLLTGVAIVGKEKKRKRNLTGSTHIVTETQPNSSAKPVTGFNSYSGYLSEKAILPSGYQRKKVAVKVKFVVTPNGEIEAIENRNSADTLIFKIAKDIIFNGPDWLPEIKNGKRVNSTVKLKIIFKKR